MAYPTELLSEGEQVEFEIRPHWRALVLPGAVFLGVIFGLVFLLNMWSNWFDDTEAINNAGRWVLFGVGLFIFIAFAVRPLLYWLTTHYVFTNRRIIIRSGLVSRRGRDMPLSKVNNVSFEVSVAGRLLNYGTLQIDSASDEALVINDVPNVEQIQREVNRLHEEDDADRRGSGGYRGSTE